MCGRVRCTLRADDVSRACYLNHNHPVRTVHADRYCPGYNVPPGSHLLVVRRGDGSDGQGTVVHCMKWGLIPSFTKKNEKPDHYKMFNGRSESIREKASFRRLVPNNRCLVAVEGFYEWKKDGLKKQPYYIHFKDNRPLVLAALYDSWEGSEGETIHTFTILTTSPSSAFRWLHDRMPVIFGDKASIDAWLNGSSELDKLLKPYEEPNLGWYPVTSAMGNPSFGGPECIQEIRLKTEMKNPIESFFSKKRIKKESDLLAQESLEKSVMTHEQKSLKEEPRSKDTIEYPSFTGEGGNDSKSSIAVLACENDGKICPKRDYEEFSADSKPTDAESKKLLASPVKKKGNANAGDKQPTLFSYFGKS